MTERHDSGYATGVAHEKTLILSIPHEKETTKSIYSREISLVEELLINMRWQWDNNLDSCRGALSALVVSADPRVALDTLKYGQRQNPHVMQLYQDGFDSLTNFWELLCRASTWQPDFAELQINLNWQKDNNLNSLTESDRNFQVGGSVAGMYYLMDGQRHNPNVMNLYRACFDANPARLIDAIHRLVGR